MKRGDRELRDGVHVALSVIVAILIGMALVSALTSCATLAGAKTMYFTAGFLAASYEQVIAFFADLLAWLSA